MIQAIILQPSTKTLTTNPETTMPNRLPLFAVHTALGAKMTYFGGWEMPLHYGSQLDEHHKVRRDAGMFDVSHLLRLDIEGWEARDFLRYLLANDVARLSPGEGLHSCMLNKAGGILDDAIVYDLGKAGYRLVLNAATRDKDLAWIREKARGFKVNFEERSELVLIAIQGPQAINRLEAVIDASVHDLGVLQHRQIRDLFISRLSFSGEDGVEVILPAAEAAAFWNTLLQAGVRPCGLGARDTLRLEAGLNLYGSEMDETTSPLVCGLAKTVAWQPADRDFSGRTALEKQRRDGVRQTLVGLVLAGRGVLRAQQRVITTSGATGMITSGTFSPTLERAIGLARVPIDIGEYCEVDIRHKYCPARVVKPPFVRHGQCLIDLS
jgi:aminomethyltransferase